MTIPPDHPPPPQPQMPSMNNKRAGAIAATMLIFVISLVAEVLNTTGAGLIAAMLVSIPCVIGGSILAIFARTRQFAVGFLIVSAIVLFVTAGACAVLIATFSR
jgi:hypothetical protein